MPTLAQWIEREDYRAVVLGSIAESGRAAKEANRDLVLQLIERSFAQIDRFGYNDVLSFDLLVRHMSPPRMAEYRDEIARRFAHRFDYR
jgi:hypothetical protein